MRLRGQHLCVSRKVDCPGVCRQASGQVWVGLCGCESVAVVCALRWVGKGRQGEGREGVGSD